MGKSISGIRAIGTVRRKFMGVQLIGGMYKDRFKNEADQRNNPIESPPSGRGKALPRESSPEGGERANRFEESIIA
jgi:hypothetical protein